MATYEKLASDIASRVIAKFHSLPSKGKPVTKSNGVQEWTVLAGMVAIHNKSDEPASFDILAITTGVKSLSNEIVGKGKGKLLHDCHAEILVIRAFNRFLVDECLRLKNGEESMYLVQIGEGFRLEEGIKFALYVSEPPCGDCSLELLHDENEQDWEFKDEEGLLNGVIRGRENYNVKGRVRTKPGRRDSPITLSKSCSDKLTVCQLKSILNGLTSLIIDPIYLDYLVIPENGYDSIAFQRCFEGRFKPDIDDSLYHLRYFKTLTTTLTHNFSKQTDRSPSGTSLIYLPHDNVQESIQKGIKEGFYSKKQYPRQNGESLLSRYQLFKQIQPFFPDSDKTYIDFKKNNEKYVKIKNAGHSELQNWCQTSTDDFLIVTS